MKYISSLVLFVVSLSSSANINAALIDVDWDFNGNSRQYSLIDTSTNLEWLDLSLTYNLSYNSVKKSLTEAGSIYEGFRFATQQEVISMWAEAGISNTQYQVLENGEWAAVNDLADRLGTTPLGDVEIFGSHVLGIVEGGLPLNENERWVMELSFSIDGVSTRTSSDFYTRDINIGHTHYGSYLVRTAVVPLPGAFWLLASGLVGFLASIKQK